ncbi:MAG: alpha-2-macroglobulin [Planctomycetes bacterium]|nr:alpha-2-macroglobulin [Planctomycetota bacterium]
MASMLKKVAIALALLVAVVWVWKLTAGAPSQQEQRASLRKAQQDGNFKVAYDGLRKLTLDPKCDPKEVMKDLELAINSLQRLGRSDEIDEYREAVIEAHPKNWHLLETAANTLLNGEQYGFITAGKFYRGNRRGQSGNFVSTYHRDRIRALQLMEQATNLVKNENDKAAAGRFYLRYANIIQQYHESWRLQYLTDLSKLPDYDEGQFYGRFGRGNYGPNQQGAPVDAEGNPVYHHIPKTYETAQSDGERWRWLLMQAAELDAGLLNETEIIFANFLRSQFDVQTMAHFGFRFTSDEQAEKKDGIFNVQTLGDNETIARLANGVKRFKLPDEFNWFKIYIRVADRGKSVWGDQALTQLAQTYEDRRQYPQAADIWRRAIREYGPGSNNNWRQGRLDQIVGNWGTFEPQQNQPAGTQAIVDFRFRNGNRVSFEAHEIKVGKLLDDVKNYLRNNPGQVDWNNVNVQNVGYRLVVQNQGQYLGAKAAAWDMELKPRPNHVDDRVTVKTPLEKPGAYLVTGQMANGNTSRIIVWVADTAILKKQLVGQSYYFVSDAVNGAPLPQTDVEYFGWKSEQIAPNQNKFRVVTTTFHKTTDGDGQVFLNSNDMPVNYQWLITTRSQRDGKPARFAYLGFTNVWFGQQYDQQYNQTKVFTITDRPVYRPDQVVHFKLWVEHAKYDQPNTSSFAGQEFTVQINDPKGEKVLEQRLTADEYGGLTGEYALPKGATLGVYSLHIPNKGGGTFRVEEYKKPEFDVTVEAPKEPVQLGEQISATINAKYYFGSPVTQAKVKYKVTRTSHTARWYPAGVWDWFYGVGYWWFSPEYNWYPGFADWGCRRPHPWWIWMPPERPELVMENEVAIAPDGTVKIMIDTKIAKELHGNQDHKYSITAEVTDESRRTIVGTGDVLVSRKPFQVYAWLHRGHYQSGDVIKASFAAQTLDRKPVAGKGELTLYQITYNDKNQPVEKVVETWKLDTDEQGRSNEQIKAAHAGQYRLSYKVTDAKQHTIEGGYLFLVRGQGFASKDFRFNDIELITDRREYNPGEKVKLLINTNQKDSTVLLFPRPANNVYTAPKVLRLKGKSVQEEIDVITKDMPNFFVEAVTVSGGRVYSDMREVIVPPEKRVLNVAIEPSQTEYKPGQQATVKLKLTDLEGNPFVGSTVMSVYDKSVEYISGGSNVPEIKEFFWKWRRQHHTSTESSLFRNEGNLLRQNEPGMTYLGVFGSTVIEEFEGKGGGEMQNRREDGAGYALRGASNMDRLGLISGVPSSAPQGEAAAFGRSLGQAGSRFAKADAKEANGFGGGAGGPGEPPPLVQPTIRKNFADTAFWNGNITTNKNGIALVSFKMPENLTGWKMRVWALGHGTKVGQANVDVVTKKDLIVRLQAPRFFTEKDEVVLSANVHNYLKKVKEVTVALELEGKTLGVLGGGLTQKVTIPSGGEKRVDWRVKVQAEGEAVVRMKALTDEDSDAMEMRFPCYVHGMLKMESWTGVIRPDKDSASINFSVPAQRRINDTVLEVRYSPSLAAAMVDALPYMVDYPYGCTEQTLNRFLPTVITQRILQGMKLDLKEIEKHQVNLNSQEIGNDKERQKGWKRFKRNPVFNEGEVTDMAQAGVQALANMQCADGGWGWFSGFGERSFPHTTATVVHGLQIAKKNGINLPGGMLERSVQWLQNYQNEQVRLLQNAPGKIRPWKEYADNIDALVYMNLVDAGVLSNEMREFLYRDRTHLAVYAKAMFGLALHKEQRIDQLGMIMKNIEQYVVSDDENQTAYLRMPEGNVWWYWYGSDIEANAYYLKLLSATNAKDERAPRLVKYILNNRKHATYWNSTRDTAICIEAMADYLKASGEDRPDMTIEVWLDGKKHKEVRITPTTLFTFDNKLVLLGDAVDTGKHKLELKRTGTGPVYFNAYLTNFTLEDFITKAGLEVRVNRKYYKLVRVDHSVKVPGSRNQPLDQKVEKFERKELKNLAELKSGDLVEIELEIDSKNDYEYLIFEDPKAAGFEPVAVRSGYVFNDFPAYMEMRDEKVCFFIRALPRGKSSVSYRMRAEIPGNFSAMPTRAYAMYAPELKGNSDEIRLIIHD